jgi:hypothetical protein
MVNSKSLYYKSLRIICYFRLHGERPNLAMGNIGSAILV